MTPREVAWGVSLSVQDGRIVIHAPAGMLVTAKQK
jgi:hypothetical protein